MAVLLVGTLDTKGVETAFVRDRLTAAGVAVVVADAGSVGPPHFQPDISFDEARHIDELLASPEVARDLKSDADGEEGER